MFHEALALALFFVLPLHHLYSSEVAYPGRAEKVCKKDLAPSPGVTEAQRRRGANINCASPCGDEPGPTKRNCTHLAQHVRG